MRKLRSNKIFPYALARNIAMLVLDVDGVLTDGGLYYDASGLSIKRFNVQDGLGIKNACQLGLRVAIITGMHSPAAAARAADMQVVDYYSGITDKITCLESLRVKYGLEWEQIAYMGDDCVDLAPMRKAGLAFSVPNGRGVAQKSACYITSALGGQGAVREVVDRLLAAQGKREAFLACFDGHTNFEGKS